MVADVGRVGKGPAVPPHPGASTLAVSARMSRFPRRDTAPEMALRHRLHAAGYRYRVNFPVPGRGRRTIDIAFTRLRVAVFIDGCFWHGCSEHGSLPKANRSWWDQKMRVTKARDVDTTACLVSAGWLVLRFWEHDSAEWMLRTVAEAVAERNVQESGR